jgi:hypothetical protein
LGSKISKTKKEKPLKSTYTDLRIVVGVVVIDEFTSLRAKIHWLILVKVSFRIHSPSHYSNKSLASSGKAAFVRFGSTSLKINHTNNVHSIA